MWLFVSLVAALFASALFFSLKSQRVKYRLDLLALMLWGLTIMIFVDHSISYLGGGPFIEATTTGLITDSVLLGLAMLAPVLLLWAFITFTSLGKKMQF